MAGTTLRSLFLLYKLVRETRHDIDSTPSRQNLSLMLEEHFQSSIVQFFTYTLYLLKQKCYAHFCPQAMPSETPKKTLVKYLSLKQKSMKDKSLLKRIGMKSTPSTKLYDKLIEVNPYWHKVDNFYFLSYPLELYFCKNKKLLYIKEYKELLEPILDHISPLLTAGHNYRAR